MTGLDFPLLEAPDAAGIALGRVLERLRGHGVHAATSLPTASPRLRFKLLRGTQQLICQVSACGWAERHLQGIAGLDWRSLDAIHLSGLTAADRPLSFDMANLRYDSACCVGLLTDAPDRPLPVLDSQEGPVWVELVSWPCDAPAHVDAWTSTLPLRLQASLGSVRLPIRHVRRLGSGDIVLLSSLRPQLRCGNTPLFDYQIQDEVLIMTTRSPESAPQDIDALPAGVTTTSTAIADLPVELEACLGDLRMTIAEISRLDTGSTVKLPADAHRNVRLVHAGHCIAIGQLVQVGDALAVQLDRVTRPA